MKPFEFHPEARAELIAAASYYAGTSPVLAQRFYAEMDSVIGAIRAHPDLYRVFDPPVRRHFGRTFPYAILYLDQSDRVWILAVAGFKQRPGYWRERLN